MWPLVVITSTALHAEIVRRKEGCVQGLVAIADLGLGGEISDAPGKPGPE